MRHVGPSRALKRRFHDISMMGRTLRQSLKAPAAGGRPYIGRASGHDHVKIVHVKIVARCCPGFDPTAPGEQCACLPQKFGQIFPIKSSPKRAAQ